MSDYTASIPKVCSPAPKNVHLGTAWLCAPGRAMTALHVLTKYGGNEFVLVFPDGSQRCATLFDSSEQTDRHLHPKFPWDVALLRFQPTIDDPPALDLNDDGDARNGHEWKTFGYPIADPAGFPTRGTVTDHPRDSSGELPIDRSLPLMCQEHDREVWKGLSGAPVIDRDGAVIATITSYKEEVAGVIRATPLRDAWRALGLWRAEASAALSTGLLSSYLKRMLPAWRSMPYRSSLVHSGSAAARPLDDIFIAPRFRTPTTKSPRRHADSSGRTVTFEWLNKELGNSRPWLIRGDPGTGKSMFFRWLCTRFALHWLSRSEDRRFIPVLAHARELLGTDLRSVIQKKIDDKAVRPPPGAVWLLLLDGLDELISETSRSEVIDRLREAVHGPRVMECGIRLLVASRPIAALEALQDQARQLVVMPFDSGQMVRFASAWFPRDTRGDMAQNFIAEVKRSRIEGMTTVPAMATMAAIVFDRSVDRALPTGRVALYDRFIELMLHVRSDEEAQAAFDAECRKHFYELPSTTARDLLAQREQIASHLAAAVQGGAIPQGPADLVSAAVLFCQKHGWLPDAERDSLKYDLERHLVRELLIGSGLFVTADGPDRPDRLDFFHNTLREALVAKARAAGVRDEASSISDLVYQWPESRWREIVLLALVRVSLHSDAARRHVGEAVISVMKASKRGLQFVGTALAEGLQLEVADEQAIVAELMDRIGRWNPCVEFFSEFRSPNPLDILRRMPGNKSLEQALLTTLRTDPTRCGIRLAAYLEYVVDIGHPDEFADVLLKPGPAADAATVLLLRAGHGALVRGRVCELLKSQSMRRGFLMRLAAVAGESLGTPDAKSICDDNTVEPLVRLSLAAHFWKRESATWAQTVLADLVQSVTLSTSDDDDAALARAIVAVPEVLNHRPRSDDTSLVILRAWVDTAGDDEAPPPDWVMAAIDDENTTPDLRLGACALALRMGRRGRLLELSVELLTIEHASYHGRQVLLDTVVDVEGSAVLLSVLSREQSWQRRGEVAAALARCGEFDKAIGWVRSTMSSYLPGSAEWVAATNTLGEIGETELAARARVDLARSYPDSGVWVDTKLLQSWGAAEALADIARIGGLDPDVRRRAVRVLSEMGALEILKQLSVDATVSPLIRLETVTEFLAIGLSAAAAQAYAMCESILGPADSESDMARKAYRHELQLITWSPSIAVQLAKKAGITVPD